MELGPSFSQYVGTNCYETVQRDKLADKPFEPCLSQIKSLCCFLGWSRSKKRAYIWLFSLPTSLNSGKALEKRARTSRADEL